MKKLFVLAALIFSLVALAAAPAAQAGDTPCVGVLTGVHDNVVVPENAVCILQNALVLGNVLAKPNSTLQINASTIRGNVQGDLTRHVLAQFQSQILGNFQVKGGPTSTTGTTGFDIFVRIGGDAKIEENRGRTFVDAANVGGNLHILKNSGDLEIEFNTVGENIKIEDNFVPSSMSAIFNRTLNGNMQVIKNVGPGFKQVAANTVSQSLDCFDNSPPFVGGPNVARDTHGQCF